MPRVAIGATRSTPSRTCLLSIPQREKSIRPTALLHPLFNTETETCQAYPRESGNYSQALPGEDIQVTPGPPGRSQAGMDLRGNVSIQNKSPQRSKMFPLVFKQRFTTVRQYLDMCYVGAQGRFLIGVREGSSPGQCSPAASRLCFSGQRPGGCLLG